MTILKTIAGMIICSLMASAAGGAAGGAMVVMWPSLARALVDSAPILNQFYALSVAVGIAAFFAIPGMVIGGVIGWIPTFVTGLLLTGLSRWRLFHSPISWVLSGAVIGFGAAKLSPLSGEFSSRTAWVSGGAVAMLIYWAMGFRLLKLRLFPAAGLP